MATLADESLPEETAPQRRGRTRVLVRIGLFLAALVVIGLVATSIVLNRYEPLANGSVFGVDGTEFREVTAYGDQDAAIFRYRHGEMAAVQFGLRNSGRLPVRIEGLLKPYLLDASEMKIPMQPIEVLVGPPSSEVTALIPPLTRYEPFEPFTLGSGEERHIAIRFRFEDCRSLGRDAVFQPSYDVRYSTLGVRGEMEVPYPYNLVVEGPVEDCPTGR